MDSPSADRPPDLPDAALARGIVAACLGHLLRLIGPEGRFVYAHPFGDPATVLPGYNLLRHCGTLWFALRALTEGAAEAGPQALARLSAAVGHAGRRLEAPAWAPAPALALRTKEAFKLGGAGLALCMLEAWGRLAAARPEAPPPRLPRPLPETVAGLRAYVLSQIDGDDFLHKRDAATGAVLPFRSDYYSGEALLGLMLTGAEAPEAGRVLCALVARGYGIAEQSHWMAYAACEGIERGALPAAEGAAWLGALVAAIRGNPAYRARRQSTPIACRAEALSRILMLDARRPGLLPGDTAATAGGLLAEELALLPAWYGDGQFRKGDGEDRVQIDYIQHSATAFLNRLALPGPPRRGD